MPTEPKPTPPTYDADGFVGSRVAEGEEGHVFLDKVGHLAYLVIDGPTDLNLMAPPMYKELIQRLEEFRDNEDLWVGILCGAGSRAFSAGGDLKRAMSWATPTPEEHLRDFWYPRTEDPYITSRIAIDWMDFEVYKPVIGAIIGHCLGAAAIMAVSLADLRIAGEGSTIGFTEARYGLAGASAGSGIGRCVPLAWAMWMCLTGESLEASQAQEIGLFNEVVPPETVICRATELGEKLCANSPLVTRIEKELLLRSYDMPRPELLRLKWVLTEVGKFGHDALEGKLAFKEQRAPKYRGW